MLPFVGDALGERSHNALGMSLTMAHGFTSSSNVSTGNATRSKTEREGKKRKEENLVT